MIRNKLFGDGIHDDTKAIQALIDNAGAELRLPMPKVRYLISAPLELPSNFKLILPRFAEIKLKKGSDCVMVKNKTVKDYQIRTDQDLYEFVNEYSYDDPCENIELEGGIWNFNNMEQSPNPIYTNVYEPKGYGGFPILFYNVRNLRVSSLTVKDPTTYAIIFDRVSYFTVDNILFDFNYGNPIAMNMDGVHLNGNCHFGTITNLKGTCYDDLVALNADEGSKGPISNIEIRGLYAENCHSAARLLSANYPVSNIHISDVYGTYFQYCLGLTRFYETKDRGVFDGITFENIYASKAERLDVYGKKGTYVYPLIWVQSKLLVKGLSVENLHRREYNTPVETFYVGEETDVEQLCLKNITTENYVGGEMPFFVNCGKVKYLHADHLFEEDGPVDLEKYGLITN
ncbi:MAG: hypothetical protein IJB80_06255 [Clostridia bacterium]|nr:hypothetical protein [Clostridia bacterium]